MAMYWHSMRLRQGDARSRAGKSAAPWRQQLSVSERRQAGCEFSRSRVDTTSTGHVAPMFSYLLGVGDSWALGGPLALWGYHAYGLPAYEGSGWPEFGLVGPGLNMSNPDQGQG